MAKVRTLSRQFMSDHPRAGQPTFFVEKFLNSMHVEFYRVNYYELLKVINPDVDSMILFYFFESLNIGIFDKKSHTIRNGNHFKTGDLISIRCWSGKPYKSKQIKLVPDIAVVKTYEAMIISGNLMINGQTYDHDIVSIANNDGLSENDFINWFDFDKDFTGQIICWDNETEYA